MDNQNFSIPPVVPESNGRQSLSRLVKIAVYSVAGVLILVGLGVGGYYFLKNNNQPSSVAYNGSPFGILEDIENYSLIKDIGITSIRYGGKDGVNWDCVESRNLNKKDFWGWAWNDGLFKETYEKGIEMSVILHSNENPVQTNRLDKYSTFVSSAAERYDGDGINDAEGSPVITYWEIDNEPDISPGDPESPWRGDLNTAKDYALTLKTAYKAIKSASPNAKVAIGSLAINIEYFEQVFIELEKLKDSKNDVFFDVFNLHFYGQDFEYGRYPIKETKGEQDGPSIGEVKALLTQYGYSDVGFIITEAGTYSDTTQTETDQAASLIKRYVYPISEGVDRIYWLGIKYQKFLEMIGRFADMSLMDKNNNKKLAYYSYKKMVEILDGSDWENVQTIQESDGVYIYKFTKNGKPIWVAWNDNSASKTISLSVGSIQTVKIAEAVPKYTSGKQIASYGAAFSAELKTAQNGQVVVTLKDIPVFIEE